MEKQLLSSARDENGRYVLQARVSPDEFAAMLDQVYELCRTQLDVPGYEKGQATRHQAEDALGRDVFYPEAAQRCCERAIRELIEEQQLPVVGYPDVQDCSTDAEGLLFTAALEAYPEVTLGDYKSIRVHIPAPEVSEGEVDLLLEEYVRQASERKELNRPAANGDTVSIDLEGTLEGGKAVPGGQAEDYAIVLGSHTFIPGLEEGMLGMSAGEKRDIPVTFPANYTPELAGKKAVFHVTVRAVCEIIVPEVNDAFAQKYFEKDLAALRAELKQGILGEKLARHRAQQEESVLSQAAGQMDCMLPETMIQQEIDRMTDEFTQRLEQQKTTLKDYLKSMQMTEEEFAKTARSSAIHRLRLDIVLKEIALAEKIEADERSISRTVELLAEQYGTTAEGVRKALTAEMLERETLRRKVCALLLKNN